MASRGAADIPEAQQGDAPVKDEDVEAEDAYARSVDPASDACLYRDLRHTYPVGKISKAAPVRAVRGISLGVRRGECFGLLGPNGAGKTTTLNCLTGEIRPPTQGEVFVAGHAVTGDGLFEAYKRLGNCPQLD